MAVNFIPIFIIGVGRSGTSLLQSMLNSHSEISFPPETHFIRSYLSKGTKLEYVENKIFEDKHLLNLGVPLKDIYESSTDLKSFYINLLNEYKTKRNKNFIGDKDPKNIEYLKLIHSLFPNAIIVHIYRDPRAVIASRLEAEWSMNKPLWQHLLAYKSQLSYGQKIGRRLFDNYLEIKYEDLIVDPKTILSQFCFKINLEYDNRMIEFYKTSNDVVKGKEVSWKKNLFNPVMKENINKWVNKLSSYQVKIIEYVLENEMRILDYNSMERLSKYERFKMFFYKMFLNCASKIYSMKLN